MKRLQTKRTNTVKIKNTMIKSFVVVCTAGLMITGCNKTEEPDKNDNSVIEDKNKGTFQRYLGDNSRQL